MTIDEVKKKYNISKGDNDSECLAKTFEFEIKEKSWWFGSATMTTITCINLAFLFNYIEKNQNLFISGNDPALKLPYLKFDISETNFMSTFYGHISSDPRICLVPNDRLRVFKIDDVISKFLISDNEYVGRLMYLLINIEYLGSILFELANEKGEIILDSFLKRILDDINRCLGGVNQLTYKVFDNVVKIIEETPLKYGALKQKTDYSKFNIYGVRPNEGSFIKKIDFNVTITNDMATMITVGAQANGNQPGVNSTAFSKFNEGLIDRTKSQITTDPGDPDPSTDKAAEETYAEADKKYKEAVKSVYLDRKLTEQNTATLNNLNSDFAQKHVGKLAENEQIPSPFFLPFDLNLTMTGLSGIKIFEKFALTEGSEKILPSYYRDNNGKSLIDFIVFDLKHSIKNNTWETTIKGKSIPSETSLEAKPVSRFTLDKKIVEAGLSASRELPKPPPPSSDTCAEAALIQISPNYNLSQLSCAAPAAKAQYLVPAPGQIKTGTRNGNITREQIITNLTALSNNVIEIIRAKYPTTLVTNAYRNKGGKSQHEVGEAVDLQFTDILGKPRSDQNALMLTRASEIVVLLDNYAGFGKSAFDQFLLEYKNGGQPWIHISYKTTGNRRDIRTFLNDNTAPNGAGRLYNPLA